MIFKISFKNPVTVLICAVFCRLFGISMNRRFWRLGNCRKIFNKNTFHFQLKISWSLFFFFLKIWKFDPSLTPKSDRPKSCEKKKVSKFANLFSLTGRWMEQKSCFYTLIEQPCFRRNKKPLKIRTKFSAQIFTSTSTN